MGEFENPLIRELRIIRSHWVNHPFNQSFNPGLVDLPAGKGRLKCASEARIG
jgi:hypothetical protein